MYTICMPGAKGDVGSLETKVLHGCEASHGCRELNLGPLQGNQELLTTELSLQPLNGFIFKIIFIYLCLFMCIHVHLCRSEDSSGESLVSCNLVGWRQ